MDRIINSKIRVDLLRSRLVRLLKIDNSLESFLDKLIGNRIQCSIDEISSYLPETIANFSGRVDILNNIGSIFNTKQIIILYSTSSTGKSAIANEYGRKLREEKSDFVIIWMKSDSDFIFF